MARLVYGRRAWDEAQFLSISQVGATRTWITLSKNTVLDKLGFIAHFVRTNLGDKKFCGAFLKATEGTGRVALYSAFLLIAFLCAYFVKEKRLKDFAIKTVITLFLLRKEAQKKKLCKKKKAVMRLCRAGVRF